MKKPIERSRLLRSLFLSPFRRFVAVCVPGGRGACLDAVA